MSKRFDNKKLVFLLGGLIALTLITFIVKIPKENATLKSRIFEVDTVEVSRVIIYPKTSAGAPFEFSRDNGTWTVKQGNITSPVVKEAIHNVFTEVQNIIPESLATIDKLKWEEFELTDSLATRVKFLSKKGKVLADVMIGKFTYKQVKDPYSGYGGNNIKGTSFVRLYSENEVYAVDEFLPFLFSGRFDDWRDKTFVYSEKNDITGIRFIYPADSSYSLFKEGTAWHVSNQAADSISVENYLNSLGALNGQDFKDNYKPVAPPVYQLMVEGNNLLNFTVKCYQGDRTDEYILNSSLNPEVYFSSGQGGIFEKLYKSRKYFLEPPAKPKKVKS